jgi:predicted heme/steroid binding protein
MASQIILKKSSIAARVPAVEDLVYGELALNYADGLLYFKKSDGSTIANVGSVTPTLTLTSGTANGLAYLNESKVLTTGTALTFDGTNFGVGVASPAAKLDLSANNPIMGYFRSSGGLANDKRFTISSGGDRVVLDSAFNSTGASAALGFTLGGTESMRLTSTGLGIGTTTPSRQLMISSATTATFALQSTTNNVGTGEDYYGGVIDFLTTDKYSALTSPVALSKIVGIVTQEGSAVPGGNLAFFTNRSGANQTQEPVERVRITTIGNVGIGTTTPTQKLEVAGTIYSTSGGFKFPDGTTQTTAAAGSSIITFATTGGAAAGSTYNGSATLTVDYATVGAAPAGHTHSYQAADGDLLAIGGLTGTSGYLKKTAADTWTLDTSVFLTSTISEALTLSSGTANGVAYLNGSKVLTTGSALTFDGTTLVASSGGSTPAIRILGAGASQGELSFNSSDTYKIQGGPDYLAINFFTNGVNRYSIDSLGVAVWSVSGTEQMRLTSTGLGIGTTTPTEKLEVTGTIYSTSGGFKFPDGTVQTTASTGSGGGGSTGTTYNRTTITATAGQTIFNVVYTVSYLQVFLNGVLLSASDYTATNGTSITLSTAAALNDSVEIISLNVAAGGDSGGITIGKSIAMAMIFGG